MSRKIIKSRIFVEQDFVESMAEVPVNKIKPWEAKEELKVVGTDVKRYDGLDKVTGKAVYTYDVELPGMIYARTLRSPHPHAHIRRIDISKAENLEGVLAIITGDNIPGIPWYWGTGMLFDKKARFQGDEIACVAAETEEIADKAIDLIKIDYELLPFVVRAEKALNPDAVKIHEWGNIPWGKPLTYNRGNIDTGLSDADIVIEETFSTQVVVHNPTEVHCSVAQWEGDHLTIWDSTQAIFQVRDTVARSLKIPVSKVRVIKKFMGGGFGSKLECGKYTVMAAILAKKTGRPVKIRMDRREMNLATGNRPDSVQKLKAAFKKDGSLTLLQHNAFGSVGGYPEGANCHWPLRSLYKCPNVSVEEYSVITNTGRARAFRAPGHVQGTFALESLMDMAAEKAGMDPIDFRIKNYTETDQDANIPYTTKRLMDAYLKGAEAIGWKEKRKPAGSSQGNIKRGIGMASQIWWGGGGPPAYATLKINTDGSANILAGTQDLGTGTYTVLAMIVAEELEIPIERIQVTLGDTETCPYNGLSGGSLTVASVTPAVRDASVQMKNKLISAAAAILDVPEDRLVYSKGTISAEGDETKKITIQSIIEKMNEEVLITTGAREDNPKGYAINTFGAQFAEVEVDTDTGKIKVIQIVAAHDIGRVISRKTLENQVHGGVIQGLGYALLEERVVDENTGKTLTTNIHDYKLPTVMDTPDIKVLVVSDGDPLISNTGAKGVGEPAIIPTAAAIANAVYNAIGVRIKSLPITPDKVLMALNGEMK